MSDPMPETEDERREKLHWEQWKTSVETEERVAHSFDRWMITLSAGALGLSITFIQQMAPNPVHTWLLCLAWGGFIVSLLCMLFSLLTSQAGFRRQREILENDKLRESEGVEDGADGEGNGGAGGEAECNRPAKVTNYLNWISLASFVVGVVFMACFSVKNLEGGDLMGSGKDEGHAKQAAPKKAGVVTPKPFGPVAPKRPVSPKPGPKPPSPAKKK